MTDGGDFTSQERDLFIDAATRCGEEIWQMRVIAKGGTITWYRPASDSRGETGERIRVDPFLYDGIAGVAIFFAALEAFHRDGQNRLRCLESLQALRNLLSTLRAHPERSKNPAIGLGGVVGIGSLLYTFSQVAYMLGEKDLLEEAGQLLSFFSPERIERDEQFDLLYGTAGAILALLAFDAVTASVADPFPLELARRCADHLLRNREADEQTGLRAWTTLKGVARLGNLNHGASGICYALLQLYRKTGEADLLASAKEGLTYESQFFVPGRGAWRDLRFPDQDRFELSWCSGSPGMAVTRLAAHDLLGDFRLHEEAETAIEALCRAELVGTDHLCCGNCGIVEALFSAAMIQTNRAWAEVARKRLRRVIDRAAVRDFFAFRHYPNSSAFDPSFFTGASGLGYTCLRLIEPALFPSVLLLEACPREERSLQI